MILVDRYIEIAIWFGAFDNEKLVGCIRVCGVDENKLLEFEHCPDSQVVQGYLNGVDRTNCLELGKLAVANEYMGRGVVDMLLLASFRFCAGNQYSAITLSSHGYLKALYRRIAFPLKKERAFKCDPNGSTFVNFYFANFENAEVVATLKNLEYLESDSTNKRTNVFNTLEAIKPIMPTPFYWMDCSGVVLGINDLCLDAIGTTREIVGKRPYDFYRKEIADHILAHNVRVIQSGEILSQEEWIEDVTTKEKKCFSAIKAPLYDDEGMIIGIIGTSIEVTAEREAERLRSEKFEQQKKITNFARKVAHDLNSPIAALKVMVLNCSELPAEKLNMLTRTIDRFSSISKNLLDIKDDNALEVTSSEPQKILALYDLVSEVVNEKRIQYRINPITFDLIADMDTQSAIVKIQSGEFKRSLSNLINNSVDSIANDQEGFVSVNLLVDGEMVIMRLRDNGKGMPVDAIEKIKNKVGFTEGKINGHGLGLMQVWDMLNANLGKFAISSKQGDGTLIEISFPISLN